MSNLKELIKPNTVLVLSKSYCPYCISAKRLLAELNVKNVNVIELDQRADGPQMQGAAQALTHQGTVPNIWIGTRHVGGNSDLQALHRSGQLNQMLKEGNFI